MTQAPRTVLAVENFRSFIIAMLGSRAHNGFRDWNVCYRWLRVTHQSMLDRFLVDRPEFNLCRNALAAELDRQWTCLTAFWVDRDRWEQTIPGLID